MSEHPQPQQNRLLAALPAADLERLQAQLEWAPLALGQALYEPGRTMSHVYFPTDAIVSLLYVMADGSSAEIAVVGCDGVVGIALFMGGGSTPSRAVVQSGGGSWRLPAAVMLDEFHRSPAVMNLMLRYTQALITQMAQTAVCNRHHMLDQQLCRWLLLSLDRVPGTELVMTQELIVNMLGVRRGRRVFPAQDNGRCIDVRGVAFRHGMEPSCPRAGAPGDANLVPAVPGRRFGAEHRTAGSPDQISHPADRGSARWAGRRRGTVTMRGTLGPAASEAAPNRFA